MTSHYEAPTSPSRRGRRQQSLRERERKQRNLCNSARKVIQEVGVKNASIRRIAARAGVNEATVYLYFRNKADLLRRVAADVYEEYLTDITDGFRTRSRFEERVVFFFERDLQVYVEEPELCRLMVQSRLASEDGLNKSVEPQYQETMAILDRCVRDAVDAEELRKDIPTDAVRDLIVSMVSGVRHRMLYLGQAIDIAEESRRMIDLLMNGVGAARARADVPAETGLQALAARVERLEAVQRASEIPNAV